jgi:tRNA (guanine37-N1)-methyltransferase
LVARIAPEPFLFDFISKLSYCFSMQFHIITLFPDSFDSYLGESILKRAIEDKKIKVAFYNPRDFSDNKFRHIDRPPYAGGPGMVIQAEPVARAVDAALKKIEAKTKRKKNSKNKSTKSSAPKIKIIFFSPSGKQFTTDYAKKTATKFTDIILICGRYEGIDARIKKIFKMEEISVGPFVLTGGELPAMIFLDCLSRQVEGVLGNFDSLEESRVASPDVYTRPEVLEYRGKKYRVPKVLLSGDHKKIEEWKLKR